MGNVLIATQILTTLLTQALQVNQLIQQAQAKGVDLSAADLDALKAAYSAAVDKLNADIAAAAAAGK